MVDRSNASPKATQSNPVPAKGDAPALVKARVRPNNTYGKARAGSIVEVDPRELITARHALISLDADEAATEAARGGTATSDVSLFKSHRAAARASAAAMRESARLRRVAELESLGITVSYAGGK